MPQDLTGIRFETSFESVDWDALRAALIEDHFDNGRTSEEYERSARNSFTNLYVYDGDRIIGNARALSDGVCNAYVIDVWVHSSFRRRGIGAEMMTRILARLEGQHVYLFTDDRVDFYSSLGFCEQPVGMSLVVGDWLGRPESSG